jgi:hypothetical protein
MARHHCPVERLLLALGFVLLAAAGALAQTLGETVAELSRKTREYQESLARLVELQEQEAARAAAAAAKYRALEPRGLVSRRDADAAERAAAAAREKVADTRGRLSDADRVLVEAQAMLRLATLPPLAPGQERATPEVIEFGGASRWALDQVGGLERFFAERFGRTLPVSALGQTTLHDRLGFDHRNALDVALHPDSTEGRALLEHLRARGVPYLAFRGAVAGASTGAHVHVGAPSPRRAADDRLRRG